MARIYLDENIGSRALLAALTVAGHSVTYCRDLGYSKVSDDFHLHVAARRGEVLVTHDADFIAIHGARSRFARQHDLSGIHAGILLFPQDNLAIPELARYADAFFAADLPIVNRLFVYREAGSWVQYHVRDEYP